MRSATLAGLLALMSAPAAGADLERVAYNNPGLVVDLGVGLWAWPLPMDYDGDGDLDLLVSCPDKPTAATLFFENPGGGKDPVFRPGVEVGPALKNVQPSYVGGEVRLLVPGREVVDFRANHFTKFVDVYPKDNVHDARGRIRANQWKLVDFDGDGRLDLLVGVGDWTEYGWDDAFDRDGRWTNGPLHGFVYLLRNRGEGDGEDEEPRYDEPVKIEAGGRPVDVFGMPSPNLADFDGDGDLDLLCGEFLDGFTYFANVGTRAEPRYAEGRRLARDGEPIRMDLEMIVPVAIDWDSDGDVDLIVGDEDGRVALVEHTGKVVDGLPEFLPPRYFRQEAAGLKFGALATPVGVDWDGDGDTDIVSGNSAGRIGFFENLGGDPPRWAAPRLLEVDGEPIRIQAGPNGSIQGPCEAKWGYTTLSAADWDGDGLPDLVVNSIWGKVVWFRNVGTRTEPELAAARPIEVNWPSEPPKPSWNWWDPEPRALVTEWRTTPVVADLTGDGLADLVMLDHEGYLALFERVRRGDGSLGLLPGRRAFRAEGPSSFGGGHVVIPGAGAGPLRLNADRAGKSGRRKLALADWDGDGRLDLLVNAKNANWLRQVDASGGTWTFADQGPMAARVLAGHDTSPTVVDWDRDGVPDLLVGAEDGGFYHLANPGSR